MINYCEFAIHYLFYSCLLVNTTTTRCVYDRIPSQEEMNDFRNGQSMAQARQKATVEEIMNGKFAVIDQISLVTCCGQKNNFYEAKEVHRRFQKTGQKHALPYSENYQKLQIRFISNQDWKTSSRFA